MKYWLWRDGRLDWRLVLLTTFSTIWLLVVDYAWRMIEMPIEILAGIALVSWLAGVALLLRVARHRPSRKVAPDH